MNKQPCYHSFDFRSADPDHVRHLLLPLVSEELVDSLEVTETGGGFTATKDLQYEVRKVFKKAGLKLLALDAEWGDPADLM